MNNRMIGCPHCGSSGQIDIDKFKKTIIKLRCPKCGKTFEHSKERRTNARIAPLPPVKIGPYGFDFERMEWSGVIQDLSLSGMKVHSYTIIPAVGDRYNFRFHLPGEDVELKAGGTIVWVTKDKNKVDCEFGVQFSVLPEDDKKRMGFFLFF